MYVLTVELLAPAATALPIVVNASHLSIIMEEFVVLALQTVQLVIAHTYAYLAVPTASQP